ncbi:MAG: stage II sporulation protein P [Eubacteriales bacterium]
MENKNNYLSKKLNNVFIIAIILLLINIIYKSYDLYVPKSFKIESYNIVNKTSEYMSEKIFIKSIPLLSYTFENTNNQEKIKEYETSFYSTFISSSVPLINYVLNQESIEYQTVSELYPRINTTSENLDYENELENLRQLPEDETTNSRPIEEQHPDSYVYTLEQLLDYNFLVKNIYTIDNSTKITMEDLDIEEYLQKDIKINNENDDPKILIFHTHSQEDFIDSKPGDLNDTVVGIGAELANILEEEYDIKTIHHKGVYDIPRDKAYANAVGPISEIIEQNPSIEIVIDLHRDGISDSMHLVTNIDGKETAKIMFFNGVCKTVVNDNVQDYYLTNPYIDDNMAFSLQMHLKAAELYPGFTRKIYLKGYRFNMHLVPQFLLVEVGAQTNTVEEAKNAMNPLARTLYEVLNE